MEKVNGARIDTVFVNLRSKKTVSKLQTVKTSSLDIRNAKRPNSKTEQADMVPEDVPTMCQGQPGPQESLGIARLITPLLLGTSANKSEASSSACNWFKVLESSSEIVVRGSILAVAHVHAKCTGIRPPHSRYFILNVTHVAFVEFRGFSVFEDHKVNVFLSGERQTRKNLE